MARKLSRIAPHGCLVLAAICAWLSAEPASAQGEGPAAPQPKIVANPFATNSSEAESVAEGPNPLRRSGAQYHNPFANKSAGPPAITPIRQGPVSRWRRPVVPLEDSPVKAAVLTTDTDGQPQSSALNLSPGEKSRPFADESNPSAEHPISSQFNDVPSPIRFAPQQLAQPIWVAPQVPQSDSIQPAQSVENSALDQFSLDDPFEEPDHFGGPSIASADDSASPSVMPPTTVSPLPPAEINADPPFGENPALSVTNNFAPAANNAIAPPQAKNLSPPASAQPGSPEECLDQAQQLARVAQSVDQLSSIIAFCERGLTGARTHPLSPPLRRLAAWARNRRGELLIDEDRSAEANHDFQVAITLDPTCSLAIHNRAVTLAQQNQSAAALRDFNRVIELNPGLAVAYRNRAELLVSIGQVQEALRDYTRAIEGLPDDADLFLSRGWAWQRVGSFDRAQADYNHAIQLAPQNPDAFTQRGNLAAERGHFDRAIADFRQALAIEPNWAEAYRSMAWLHATCPNPRYRNAEQALVAAQRAADLSPANDCFVLDALAAAHASADQFDEAARFQEQAIAYAPPGYAQPLQARLALYRQGQPFLSGPDAAVHAASHEEAPVHNERQ